MLNIGRNTLLVGMLIWMSGTTAQAIDPWRVQALRAADRMAETVEILDETLHEAYEHHSTPQFKKAIEDMHHIEDVLTLLRTKIPAAPFNDLCDLRDHLLEDLVQIRLDLIALGLQSVPSVVRAWNNMANVYNYELNPLFRTCPPHWSGRGVTLDNL